MDKQVDILIIGAGISGIGLAAHLIKKCPQRSFEIIETSSKLLVALGIYFNTLVFVLIRICRPLVIILNLGKKPMYLADGASIKGYLAEVIQ